MEVEDALVKFEVVNFVDGFRNFFCVVEDAHLGADFISGRK